MPDRDDTAWRWVTLHLARGPGAPAGSDRTGYHLHLPLDPAGRIDAAAWRADAERGIVVRFDADQGERLGWLEHRPGGLDGATWVIDYDAAATADDEPGYRLGHHVFRIGEYVTVGGRDGEHTYRVVAVSDRAPLGAAPARRLSSRPTSPAGGRR
ncbi:MAG: hypothetical protein AB7O45_16935 [Alphaproteobacteria bacterium]